MKSKNMEYIFFNIQFLISVVMTVIYSNIARATTIMSNNLVQYTILQNVKIGKCFFMI